MTNRYSGFARVRNHVLFVSGAAWIILLNGPGTLTHCAMVASEGVSKGASLRMLLAMNPPAFLAMGWALMMVAMMSPLLIPPIRHVWLQSFQHRRTRSIGLFVAGYAAMWLVAGALLLAVELAAALFLRRWYFPVAGTLIGLMWQFSPIKQFCLNRGHVHMPLAAFGFAADRDSLLFGMSHGIWCFGSCWALMMVPMLLPAWHVASMAVLTFLIFSERLEQPVRPCWGWRVSSKLMRIIFAQTRIRLNSFPLAPAWNSSNGSNA